MFSFKVIWHKRTKDTVGPHQYYFTKVMVLFKASGEPQPGVGKPEINSLWCYRRSLLNIL